MASLRLALASHLELAGAEALALRAATEQPWVTPVTALSALGTTEATTRLLSALLATGAAAVAGVAAGPLALALVAAPIAGIAACTVGPAAGLWVGWLLVWSGARVERPWVAAGGVALAVVSHGVGVLTLLGLAAVPSPVRRHWAVPMGAVGLALVAWCALPGVLDRLVADLVPQAGWADGRVSGLLPLFGLHVVLAVGAGVVRRLDPVAWWLGMPGLVGAVAMGEPLLAAGPLSVLACAGLDLGPRWRRAASVVVGINAVGSALLAVHLAWPLASLQDDPRATFVGGPTLTDSVVAWDLEPVYCEDPDDAALLWFYGGLDAGPVPPEPVVPSLYVRPWAANLPLPTDASGLDRGGPNSVSAWVSTPDPLVDVPVRRWQVYRLGPVR